MLLGVSLLALCALTANVGEGAPATGDVDYIAYLTRYYYLGENNPDPRLASLTADESLQEAFNDFQHMADIKMTGIMDDATRAAMLLPRCGVPDLINMGSIARKRKRRFLTQGSRWKTNDLTYRISIYTSDIPKDIVDAEIKRALNVWASVTPLTFTQKDSGKVDIDIQFVRGEHGDGNPFDGPRGTLAHAFFPKYGGDAHFDEDETWVVKTGPRGSINLFQVAAHEFGHSLGLAHTDVPTALMAPFYRGYQPNFTLDPDDIAGIQAIYKKSTTAAPTKPKTTTTATTTATAPTSTTTTPPPTTTTFTTTTTITTRPTQKHTTRRSTTARVTRRPYTRAGDSTTPTSTTTVATTTTRASGTVPDLCLVGRLDTITQADDDKIYAFRGSVYMEIGDSGIAAGFPRAIADDWPGLPSNIDAALTWPASYSYGYDKFGDWVKKTKVARVYFFKGDKYWKYENKQLKAGYPKLISDGFTGVPNDIDAAFVWSGNGKTYFIKGDNYYRYIRGVGVDVGYPRPLRVWKKLPPTVSSAFQWRTISRTYFFSGKDYYRFNDRRFVADTQYPRSLAKWWYGCREASRSNSLISPGDKESAADDKSQFIGVSVVVNDATTAMDDDVTTSDTSDISRASVMSSVSLAVCLIFATLVTFIAVC